MLSGINSRFISVICFRRAARLVKVTRREKAHPFSFNRTSKGMCCANPWPNSFLSSLYCKFQDDEFCSWFLDWGWEVWFFSCDFVQMERLWMVNLLERIVNSKFPTEMRSLFVFLHQQIKTLQNVNWFFWPSVLWVSFSRPFSYLL